MNKKQSFDCIIIGGGPAGLTAGIYCTRAGLSTLIIEHSAIGGQILQSEEIDNYPGFKAVSGFELSEKMFDHANSLGVKFVFDSITKINLTDTTKEIETELSGTFVAKAIILAMGAKAKRLGIENEEKFIGRGVNFCATCDGAFYKDKNVVVSGGGNAAAEEAIALSKQSKKVSMVVRDNKLTASVTRIQKLSAQNNVDIIYNSEVVSIKGEGSVQSVEIKNLISGKVSIIKADGLFVSIGRSPTSDLIVGHLKTDDEGFVIVDEDLQTSVKGVFAAGDIRKKQLRQIITSCADGVVASDSVNKYLN